MGGEATSCCDCRKGKGRIEGACKRRNRPAVVERRRGERAHVDPATWLLECSARIQQDEDEGERGQGGRKASDPVPPTNAKIEARPRRMQPKERCSDSPAGVLASSMCESGSAGSSLLPFPAKNGPIRAVRCRACLRTREICRIDRGCRWSCKNGRSVEESSRGRKGASRGKMIAVGVRAAERGWNVLFAAIRDSQSFHCRLQRELVEWERTRSGLPFDRLLVNSLARRC